MVLPSAGQVVLIPFPFSDLSHSKLRPALVLADAGRGDWIMVQITSQPYGDSGAVQLTEADFVSGGLPRASFIRPAKLFTLSQELIRRSVGTVNSRLFSEVIASIGQVLAQAVESLRPLGGVEG